MNGNIFNYFLASEQYSWSCGWGCSHKAYAIPPAPPGNISTITGEPIFVQSYINAYNTAFNQETPGYNLNYQKVLNNYNKFTYSNVNSNFVPGTFGYKEEYNTPSQRFYINYLQDVASVYVGTPFLFISAGSGGGSGFMNLNWVIVTYGVPYVVSVS
jgi:hypothetical protein